MDIDGQSVARWEKTSKVPRWADKLVRLVKQKIMVKESRGQWRPSLQNEDVATH